MHKVLDYPCANFYTIWSSNITTTDMFQYFMICVQTWLLYPKKREVFRFQGVYQTFSHFRNSIETNHRSRLLYSENSHDSYKTNSSNYTLLFIVINTHGTFPDHSPTVHTRSVDATCPWPHFMLEWPWLEKMVAFKPFSAPDRVIGDILFLSCLFVCLSVCLLSTLTFALTLEP